MKNIDGNRITQSVIVGIVTLVATIIWVQLKEFLYNEGGWLGLSIGFFILLSFLSLNWLLSKSKILSAITFVFVLISFFFVFEFRWEYLAVVIAALFLLFLSCIFAINEKNIRLKIDVVRILKRGLPIVLTALSLIIASAYYFSPLSLRGDERIEIPRPLFDTVATPALEIAQNQFLGQFSGQEVRIGAAEMTLIKEEIYQALNGAINNQNDGLKEFLPISLSIGVFFALKAVGVIFIWLVILFTFLIFKILLWTGAIHIQQKAVLKEVIEV